MALTTLDTIVFLGYIIGVVLFAIAVAARSKTKSSGDYFLASRKLPWYAVGASFVASNISTEHFIGMVGWGFLYGMAVANWEWINVITFSALIWIFLPFYMRGNVSTMPEFLEMRFNKTCRYIYAIVMIIGLVIAMLGGVLFAGAKAINVFFPQIPLWGGIIILAVAAGTYTVYGGLLSAVWADLLQYCLLMVGGLTVSLFGLYYAGGFSELYRELPERFIMLYSSTHEMIPWTGLVSGLLSVGLWYSCANQFMVQRCLGARSEWDGRMGVVMALFSKALLPLIVVIPGIIAFYLFQDQINDGDQAWPFMVKQFLPAGLVGLVLAGLASAIMSTLSAITNSSATIFTLDIYKSIFSPDASDKALHWVGRVSAFFFMVIGVVVGIILAAFPGITVFQVIQTVFFYVAAPIAAVFLVGIMWRRATPVAATATLVCGFLLFLPLVVFVIFPEVGFLVPYDNFMHHTFLIFILSIILLILVSFFTKPRSRQELTGIVWTRSALTVSEEEKKKNKGFRNLALWWFVVVVLIVTLYTFTQLVGSKAECYEAEDLEYRVSGQGHARLQKRSELANTANFNLWTGSGQVLFESQQGGESILFELPVKREGTFRVDVLVTTGPHYAPFYAELNGRRTEIKFQKRIEGAPDKALKMQERDTFVFPPPEDARGQEEYFVRRISLGYVESYEEYIQVRLTATSITSENRLLGIDQFVILYAGEATFKTEE